MSDQATRMSAQASWRFVLAGFASLLVASYYDNIRGPLLTPMATSLGLDFGEAGLFLAVGHGVATVTTLLLIRALNLWSERQVMVVLCLGGIGAGLLATTVESQGLLFVLAGLVGSTVSTLGTMSNVLVVEGAPPRLQGRLLSALHGMFGLGSMVATTVVGLAVGAGARWSTPYLGALPLCCALLVFAWFGLRRRAGREQRTVQTAAIGGLQVLVVATFAVYVAGEVAGAVWMTTYLVKARGLALDEATPVATAYFLVMTLSRLACALFLRPQWELWVIRGALVAPLAAFALGYLGPLWAFALVGLYGPFFPVFLARASRQFPDSWRSLTIWIMVAMNVLIGLFNLSLGRIADAVGIQLAYLLAPGLLLSALVLVSIFLAREKRSVRDLERSAGTSTAASPSP